jgi:hypothetical protein
VAQRVVGALAAHGVLHELEGHEGDELPARFGVFNLVRQLARAGGV